MTVRVMQITQRDLEEIYELKRDVAQKSRRIGELESLVKAALREGTAIEMGRFYPRLVFKSVRNPAWKQVVIDMLGSDFADRFWRNCKPVTICDLQIEEHAIPPLWKAASPSSDAGL